MSEHRSTLTRTVMNLMFCKCSKLRLNEKLKKLPNHSHLKLLWCTFILFLPGKRALKAQRLISILDSCTLSNNNANIHILYCKYNLLHFLYFEFSAHLLHVKTVNGYT